jgi:hypothetical protein
MERMCPGVTSRKAGTVSRIVLLDVTQADITAGGDGTGNFKLSLGAKKAAVIPVMASDTKSDSSTTVVYIHSTVHGIERNPIISTKGLAV